VEQGVLSNREDISRLFRAYHIMQWRRESAYCGACGSRNIDAGDELARLCPVCGRREYPRISPAIIVLVTNDRDEALLAHNKKFPGGVYSLIAGFNEAGENLETTAAREVREEAGIEIDNIRYEASQPWPFPNSLMIGFTARHVRGEIRPDGEEIEDARWFRRDALPKLPGPGSVSRYLIEQWLRTHAETT
jgi:NAD+ diphosphatase